MDGDFGHRAFSWDETTKLRKVYGGGSSDIPMASLLNPLSPRTFELQLPDRSVGTTR